jgi:hypothetical protein
MPFGAFRVNGNAVHSRGVRAERFPLVGNRSKKWRIGRERFWRYLGGQLKNCSRDVAGEFDLWPVVPIDFRRSTIDMN